MGTSSAGEVAKGALQVDTNIILEVAIVRAVINARCKMQDALSILVNLE